MSIEKKIENPLANYSQKQVRGILLWHNLTIKEFSEKHGLNLRSVTAFIERYPGNKTITPTGFRTVRVLEKLSPYLKPFENFGREENHERNRKDQ